MIGNLLTKQTVRVIKERVPVWLSSKKIPTLLAVLAIALAIQSLTIGLQWDDYLQREIILKRADWAIKDATLTGMFAFFNGDPESTKHQMDIGIAPWWTFEKIRLSFFRPLTEITHWLDYRLWPESPVLMHVQSLLWFGSMVFAAAVFYRRVMEPKWVAGIAAFLFAVDESHAGPVTWLASRNALIAATFGIVTLLVHDRWRRDGWKPGAVIGPVCLLLGLFSAEAAVATGAYLVSYEIFLVHGNFRKKIIGLIPYAVVAIVWWITHHRLGFGAFGSGSYIDPGQEPVLFLRALVERIPLLLFAQWLFSSVVFFGTVSPTIAYFAWIAVNIFLAVIAYLLLPLLRRDAIARFWALGMILALPPICAVFPEGRLLLFVGLGAMGLMAQFLSTWFIQAEWVPASAKWRMLARVFVFVLIITRCIVSPIQLFSSSQGIKEFSEKPFVDLPRDDAVANKTVIFVNPPFSFFVLHTPFMRAEYGRPAAAHMRPLISGLPPDMYIKRVDERSLELQPEEGFLVSNVDKIFRGTAHPMQVGQRVVFPDMTAEVLSLTEDKRPLRVRFTFSALLDDPSLLFLEWKSKSYIPFDLPAVGRSVRMSWARMMEE